MTPHLTYQILTKRPENIRSRLPANWGRGWPNVWLGVSIESVNNIDRGFDLEEIPAQLRFISAEPLLGVLPLIPLLMDGKFRWVIVGGESGPGCRPMDPKWARFILEDCKYCSVAYFMKQMGGWPDKHGEIPPDLQVFEFPDGTRLRAQL